MQDIKEDEQKYYSRPSEMGNLPVLTIDDNEGFPADANC